MGSHPSVNDLPGELLAEILRRLPPRSLAACRSVCTLWRAVVDARGILLAVAHLVPRSLRGIFINYLRHHPLGRSHGFFSRAAGQPVDGGLSFVPGQTRRYCSVLDHRNGLLLYETKTAMYVCNPATRRWATLPTLPRLTPVHHPYSNYGRRMYLMFDPTVSLHYHVFFFSEVPKEPTKSPRIRRGGSHLSTAADYKHERNTLGSAEWPPYMYPVQVFSSRTSQWEDRQLVREGGAAVTVSDVRSDGSSPLSDRMRLRRHAVYWQESFYVHCDTGFVMRYGQIDAMVKCFC
ncbi:hypothetical protein QYE76_039205 [Lolium multiflorum]|uniref:F-box domain-containing protein n=1 Tax=Lolium multiflorum TaxID=4521 RepID=A0AAD8TAI8_LOLMU|nr:hypothetical protein QYE76_039205 [Lolium multiflorum]